MAIHRMQIITQCIQYTKIYSITRIQKFEKKGRVEKYMLVTRIHSHLQHRQMEYWMMGNGVENVCRSSSIETRIIPAALGFSLLDMSFTAKILSAKNWTITHNSPLWKPTSKEL